MIRGDVMDKKVFYNLHISVSFRDAIRKRARQLGYSSMQSYIKATLKRDIQDNKPEGGILWRLY